MMASGKSALRTALMSTMIPMIRKVGRGLGPDGDWQSVALLERPGGEVVPVQLEGEHWTDGLLAIARGLEPQAITVVTMARVAWLSEHEQRSAAISAGDVPLPSDRSDSHEYVILWGADAEGVEWKMARVRRRPRQAPLLGEFEPPPEGVSGFAEPIAELFAQIFGVDVEIARQ
jgi:hypothetical protein